MNGLTVTFVKRQSLHQFVPEGNERVHSNICQPNGLSPMCCPVIEATLINGKGLKQITVRGDWSSHSNIGQKEELTPICCAGGGGEENELD